MGAFTKRIIVILLIMCIVSSFVACGISDDTQDTSENIQDDTTLSLWYTDDHLTAYLKQAADEYHKANQHITIEPKLVEEDDYLENIYNGSIKQNDIADLYMLSSDNLEKAYLMGITSNNDMNKDVFNNTVYGNAGIEAASYNNKLVAYPLSFDTTFMVYNKKYVSVMGTFADLTNFSNNFQHNDQNSEVQYVVDWDVSDGFLNYAFVGPYMNIGGSSSDDGSSIQLNNNGMKASLNEYLKFKADYGIDRSATTDSSCLDLFKQNKLLYTIIKTNDLKAINDSGVNYGICKIPDLTNSISSKSLSITQLMAVNPYSKNVKAAKNVAKSFTYDYAGELFDLTGYVCCRSDLGNYPSSEFINLYSVYSNSIVKAQFMNIGDFYIKLEIMLHQIWDGANVDDNLSSFSNYVTTQLLSKPASK